MAPQKPQQSLLKALQMFYQILPFKLKPAGNRPKGSYYVLMNSGIAGNYIHKMYNKNTHKI